MSDTKLKADHPPVEHDGMVNVYGSGPLPVGERDPVIGSDEATVGKPV